MDSILLVVASFLAGSLPFSLWLGKILVGKDVRQFGDGNPGATNVFRAGSKPAGTLALMLDISKAAVPVGISYYNLQITGIPMFFIAIAPMLGHMFSPFLRFRGGKALATTLGIWIGLTVWKASLVVVLFAILGLFLFRIPGWAALTGLFGVFLLLALWMPDPLMFAVLVAQVILISWAHRSDLRKKPDIFHKPVFRLGGAKH